MKVTTTNLTKLGPYLRIIYGLSMNLLSKELPTLGAM